MAGHESRRRTGVKTLLFVVVALAMTEIGVRVVESRLSVDIEHIQGIPTIVSELARDSETAMDSSLLFLGNSLTRRGVDTEVFSMTLEDLGVEGVQLAAVYPDDTSVLDWHYLYQDMVMRANAVPDVVVIGYGFWHLEDRPVTRAQTYRLGRYYTAWEDISGLFRNDVARLGDRINVLLAKLSAAFANRERIAQRVLSFLPYYQQSARRLNDMVRDAEPAGTGDASEVTYERLIRLIELIEGSGAELILIAMPTRDGYILDPRVSQIAAASGSVLIDARQVPGLTSDQFEDNIHLDPDTGAKLYSEFSARLLAPVLPGLLKDQ